MFLFDPALWCEYHSEHRCEYATITITMQIYAHTKIHIGYYIHKMFSMAGYFYEADVFIQ